MKLKFIKCDYSELDKMLLSLGNTEIKFITEVLEPECGRYTYTIFFEINKEYGGIQHE